MEENDREPWLKKLLPYSAIIIALISALAYICAYIYEISFCNHFGIPHDFIVVNWTRFLICSLFIFLLVIPVAVLLFTLKSSHRKSLAATALLGTILVIGLSLILKGMGELTSWAQVWILVIVLALVNFYLPVLERFAELSMWMSKRPKGERNKSLIVVCVLVILLVILRSLLTRRIAESLPIGILLLVLIFLLIYSKEIQEFQFKKRFYKFMEGHRKLGMFLTILFYPLRFLLWLMRLLKIKSILGKLKNNFFTKKIPMILVGCLCFSSFLLYAYFGNGEAENGREYLVPSSNQRLVVFRVYGDHAICAPWYVDNHSGNYTTKEFTILPLEGITLTPQQIGPLHVK